MADARNRIGQRLQEVRKAQGMTQQDVADKSGVTRTTVSKIEAGKFNAGVDIVDRLARSMGASLDIVPAEGDDTWQMEKVVMDSNPM